MIYKRYADAKNITRENTEFRKELFDKLKCETISMENLLKIDYKRDKLIELFENYNQCVDSEYEIFQSNKTKILFNITAATGFSSSSVQTNYYFNGRDFNGVGNERVSGKVNFANQINLVLGIGFEVKLPFSRNKWAFFTESTFQSYGEATEKAYISDLYIGDVTVKFSYLEIPFGIRHYIDLNNRNAKISISVAYVPTRFFNEKESYVFEQDEGFIFAPGFGEQKKVNTSTILFGLGYDLNKSVGVKINFYPSRKVISNNDFISDMNGLITLMASYKLL